MTILFVSIAMIYYTNPISESAENSNNNKLPSDNNIIENYEIPRPPPRKAQNVPNSDKIYIAIIDTEYKSSDHQCSLRESWVDNVESLYFVDGVELYSNVSFKNDKCNFTTVSFPRPSSQFNLNHNPSCMIMRNMIRLFLERSTAGWLLYVSDSAFINAKNLQDLIKYMYCQDPEVIPRVSGQCLEVRDYFEVFAKNSGSLISRKTAELINSTDKIWNISCEIEIDGTEAIAHVLDVNTMYAITNDNQRFLGNPFNSRFYYDALQKAEFYDIKKCPESYSSKRVCHPVSHQFNQLAVWSSVGDIMNKYDFIKNARKMMDSAGDHIYFKFDVYKSELCKI